MNWDRLRADLRRPRDSRDPVLAESALRGHGPERGLGQVRSASEPTRREIGAIVGVLALAVFMSSLDLFIVNLAFPYIGREYPGTTLSSLSWVLNAYTIVFAAVLLPPGPGADSVRRRPGFILRLP